MSIFTKRTKAQRVRDILIKQGHATNHELNKICFRYGSIIHGMRKDGHQIVTNRLNNDGLYDYVYKGEK